MEAVAATLQPHSLCVTLQPLHLLLSPLCSYWSSCFLQQQFQLLLPCSAVVTVSSADTSLFHLYLLVYFLSSIFLSLHRGRYHPRFLKTTEHLRYKNCHCLHSCLVFTFFYCFMPFFQYFYVPLLLFSFPLMFVLIFLFLLSLTSFTFPVCSCNLFVFDFYSYLSLHLISLFAQFIPIKCFWFTALFAQAACLPGERLRHEGVG